MIEPWIGDCFFLCDVLNLKEHVCSSVETTVKIHAFKMRKLTFVINSVSCTLHTVEFGNPKTGYIFVQILKSGYAKRMLIDKVGITLQHGRQAPVILWSKLPPRAI